MIVRQRKIQPEATLQADVCIVGAGVAATLAGGWGAFLDWSTVVGLSNFSIYTFNLGFRKEF